jgi:putative ABC transport system permease protein
MTSKLVPHIQRQIVLPTSKALEIAYKSIRLRLSRSLLVTSGIALALAFLMSVLTSEKLNDSMRRLATRDSVPGHASMIQSVEAQKLQQLMRSNGVPIAPTDIQADGIQTRWLLALALMVAFVGILNSMLMSVTERFREIGTMKCLGALDEFIIKLFLIESLIQGTVGTALGLALGLVTSIAGALMNYGSFVWRAFPWWDVAESASVSLVVGIGLTVVGALYPAWHASRMQPIEAMRVET